MLSYHSDFPMLSIFNIELLLFVLDVLQLSLHLTGVQLTFDSSESDSSSVDLLSTEVTGLRAVQLTAK